MALMSGSMTRLNLVTIGGVPFVRAIRGCAAFVVLLTPESDESRWVQREVTLAEELKKPVFPLLLGGDLLSSENWTMFVRTQYEDVRGGKLPPARFYGKLVDYVPRKQHGKDVTETQNGHIDRSAAALNAAKDILPSPFEWREIPAGQVSIQYGKWHRKENRLRYVVTHHESYSVDKFVIAKYPITNAQYQVFLDANDGYRDNFWWEYSPYARQWHKTIGKSKLESTAFPGHDLPRTYINWYDAVAFCRWLQVKLNAAKSGFNVSLPTELQWQFAAQGIDNRTFPWGREFNPLLCNTFESKLQTTTSVTAYSEGVSPFGVFDMSGNVWEWCLTTWNANRIELDLEDTRVLRGGSLLSESHEAQVFIRNGIDPINRINDVGFRICATSVKQT
jgi:formylglycine-generating enzyme required for sulfatase activity